MQQIKKWTAKRSGPGLVIIGYDVATDRIVKLTGISRIEAGMKDTPSIFAVRDAERFELLAS